MNDRLWLQSSKFCVSLKKTNGQVGRVFKILHFAVKNEWPFGYNCKILYFPVKNPVVVWVHALSFVFHFYEGIEK